MSERGFARLNELIPGISLRCCPGHPWLDTSSHTHSVCQSPFPRRVHVALAGGGTAGHLVPGLAVAQSLRSLSPQMRLTFLVTGKPLEERLVRAAGFASTVLSSAPWTGFGRAALRFAARMLAGYRQARHFLLGEQVSLVVALGGYGAAPAALAAVRSGVPLVVLEQNALPGRTTRCFARSARAVCLAIPDAAEPLPACCRVHLTGNPLRAEFEPTDTLRGSRAVSAKSLHAEGNVAAETPRGSRTMPAETPRPAHDDGPSGPDVERQRRARLLVLGGSGGARWLNEHLPGLLARERESLAGWEILHQTGPNDVESTRGRYAARGLDARVTAFIDNMPAALRGAGLVVCRAGATTLSELAATGAPAVLIPYPHAADDHQQRNAHVFGRSGAAIVVDQRGEPQAVEASLSETLRRLLADGSLRRRMAQAMSRQARPGAAQQVARLVLSIAARRAMRTASPGPAVRACCHAS